MDFVQALQRRWREHDTLLCVGLDPEPNRFPEAIGKNAAAIFDFNKAIIDATAELVCAYKPQAAHYSAYAAEDALLQTIAYIHERHPGIPVILDSKRGDIGSTAELYAKEAFVRYGADAATVNPYLGLDGIRPYLEHDGKGVIVLCRTSNPSAREFQDLDCGGKPFYRVVAERATTQWGAKGNLALVIGATYPEELAEIRAIAGETPFLVPGVGAQGGSAQQAVSRGATSTGEGLIISASRSILYASAGEDFAQAAARAACELRDEINLARRRS